MNKKQITVACLVLLCTFTALSDLVFVAFGFPTYSRIIKDAIGPDATAYFIGFVIGGLAVHFSNW